MPYTLIAIVNAETSEHLGDIRVDGPNVQAMAFEPVGAKMYADLADINKIAVIDREKRTVLTVWPTTPECQRPYSLALDSAHHRLFVGCRMYATQAEWWQPEKMNADDGCTRYPDRKRSRPASSTGQGERACTSLDVRSRGLIS
jgi:hypothetical protein